MLRPSAIYQLVDTMEYTISKDTWPYISVTSIYNVSKIAENRENYLIFDFIQMVRSIFNLYLSMALKACIGNL